MSALKPIILPVLVCGMIVVSAHADAISWPSGLDNWVVYLAAPTGAPGTGPIAYNTPQLAAVPVEVAPSPTSEAPAAFAAPDASSQSAQAQAVVNANTSSSSLASPTQTASVPVSAPAVASVPTQSATVQTPSYTSPASAPPSTYSPPVTAQTRSVQPLTYIQPVSSQPSNVQPMRYTPLSSLPSAPQTTSQPVASTTSPSTISTPSHSTVSAPSLSTIASAPVAPPAQVHALINVGAGPYALASAITTGGAQPWYNSNQLSSFFGGQPTAQQIQSFDATILQRVQQTFSQSGIAVSLTENGNVPALHTVSLVSNTASSTLSSAIGMTQVGSSGFSFIDQIAPSAHSLDQLEWIAAHNISHELMLAFGVPENFDKTGNFIDSKLASWSMMVNPNATFSPDAAQAINQALGSQTQPPTNGLLGAQEVNPSASPVPEPATLAMWGIAAVAVALTQRLRSGRIRALGAA